MDWFVRIRWAVAALLLFLPCAVLSAQDRSKDATEVIVADDAKLLAAFPEDNFFIIDTANQYWVVTVDGSKKVYAPIGKTRLRGTTSRPTTDFPQTAKALVEALKLKGDSRDFPVFGATKWLPDAMPVVGGNPVGPIGPIGPVPFPGGPVGPPMK